MTKEPPLTHQPVRSSFGQLKTLVQKQFKALVDNGPLFYVELDRDLVWQTYLGAFHDDFKQEHTCSCCKSFLRQFGGIVGLKSNKIISLWDIDSEACSDYAAPVTALRRYVASLPIAGPYLNNFPKCGTDRSPDPKRVLIWEHFYIELPAACVKREDAIGPIVASARDDQAVLLRSINEITPDAVDTVLDLIGQGSLYRGSESQGLVKSFHLAQKIGREVPAGLRANFCWAQASTIGAATCRIRNSAIGTLLQDLSEGKELDHAVRAFESVVAPANYKRPTALITPAMIKKAQERLEELGLTGSLQRRLLTDRDLTAENALHVYRPAGDKSNDIFAQLTQQTIVNPKTLTKTEEISIEDFLTNVLPTAKSVRVLVENPHLSNLVTLVGPKNLNDPTMFKWNNNFSWSYVGEVADSVKQRVKAAGGNVTGYIRCSLSWHNYDDLDLHCVGAAGDHIFYGNRVSSTGGVLDLDMNAGGGYSGRGTREPVENICWENPPTKDGKYRIYVHQYARVEDLQNGFEVEIECDGELHSFSFPNNGPTGKRTEVATFEYSRSKGFALSGGTTKTTGYPSNEKWGVKTGVFHPVKAITLSPNHWGTNVGNKHFFFLLEGCETDEKTRGFYNEFLKQELDQDRKVFEVLGSKVEVETAPGQLSGLGFSETVRNHLFVEVEGEFQANIEDQVLVNSNQNHTNIMSDINTQFIRATRKKLRFESGRGQLAIEDLWDLSLPRLNEMAIILDEAVQQKGRKSFIDTTPRDTDDTQLKFDLVKFVIDTKLAEALAAKERAAKHERKEFLKDLLQRKQTAQLEGLSAEEIQAQLNALDEPEPAVAG